MLTGAALCDRCQAAMQRRWPSVPAAALGSASWNRESPRLSSKDDPGLDQAADLRMLVENAAEREAGHGVEGVHVRPFCAREEDAFLPGGREGQRPCAAASTVHQ